LLYTLPESQDFLWNLSGNLHDLDSCILWDCKIGIMWMTWWSATSSIWVLLDHGYSDHWIPGHLDSGKHFSRWLWVIRLPPELSSRESF
jgi:hypothetical protein